MEPFTNYKMFTQAKSNIFNPPVYCRRPSGGFDIPEGKVEELPKTTNLSVTNPAKLLHLIAKLKDNSTKELEVRLNKYLLGETGCSDVFMVNYFPMSEEAMIQTINGQVLEHPNRFCIPLDTMKKLNGQEHTDKHHLDQQFVDAFHAVLSDETGEIISVPILSNRKCKSYKECPPPTEYPVLIVNFVNSKKDEAYLAALTQETMRYCLTIFLNTAEAEEEARQKRQCQELLMVARNFFSHLTDLSDLLKEIMSEARRLTDAERCSLFLLEPDDMYMVAKVFDGTSSSDAEVKILKGQGIAGHVVSTGELLNITNAYEHPLFYKGMDEATGFKTRNILCFPIRDKFSIVGVAQLCNKKIGHFDFFDEELANAFSIFCGLSIMHSLIYKKIEDTQARSKLCNELMMYHMHVNEEDVIQLLTCPRLHVHPEFNNLDFSVRAISIDEYICFILKIYEDLGFIELFKIRKDTLARFILFVKKGYRDNPYHNFTHAFSVCHFAYLCLENFHLVGRGFITRLEALALVTSALCHDLDHRGTTNTFQQQSDSILANLYSSEGSVLERHHLSQTICTLNAEGCNFLESLKREDYILCLDLIKDMILATDLANHFKIYTKQLIMVQEGYDCENPENRYALLSLIMTCADLSDQTKSWSITKKVVQMVFDEFFAQGDLEKSMGRKPMEMMDRDKAAKIPDLQIEFLKSVCLPVFKLLATMFPMAKSMVDAIKSNILSWEASKSMFNRLMQEGMPALDILVSEELEKEVSAMLRELNESSS